MAEAGVACMSDYRAFLASKVALAADHGGFDVAPEEVHPCLKPHQRAIVQWAVRGGRRAIFTAFGLGKTVIQLETLRLILAKSGGARALVVLPLGVRQEFTRDAGMLGLTIRFIRRIEEADAPGLYMTNYETVRDGKLDPRAFQAISLDEAGILRGFGGTKTFRAFMTLFEGTGTYRFVATATPSPNEYIELLAYAGFLEAMDIGQAKTRFFKRDSTKADHLTLHAHKVREFWLWVSSWAIFVQAPSDLGYDDTGYVLPTLDVRWHEIPSDHAAAGVERDGQGRMFRDSAYGVSEAAREKRGSLAERIATLQAIRAEAPGAHRIIWHDLEAERKAIEAAISDVVSVYGSQDLDAREAAILAFSDGHVRELAAKPVMLGSGVNLQRHCAWAIFLGIGFKFNDFIQAIHRIQRFLQARPVRIDLIYTEAERGIRRVLETKWGQHKELVATMADIIREYGLSRAAMADALRRSIGVERVEVAGDGYRVVNHDCVEETRAMPADCVDLIVTSIPFATQYEYTPSYHDFGHTEDTAHFWRQMDFLTPELLRVLEPGRVAVIHVKDRIVPGGLTGLGFQTLAPFHAEAIFHYQRHGFAFLGMKTVVTDVVRENNQTYRLGWTEQCKDGSRMGCGVPEYLLLFRKPPSDRSNGYADVPVVKAKRRWDDGAGRWEHPDGYSLGQWQRDAHGFARSNGNRPLSAEDLDGPHDAIFQRFRDWSRTHVYEVEAHAQIAETLIEKGRLPVTFMLLQPASWHPDVWTDIARMRTLNMLQERKGQQMHLCPIQFDIADRLIVQLSNPGDVVYDPFAGLMTVPYCAVKLGRVGWGVELNRGYFADGVVYVESAARDMATPTLFDLVSPAPAPWAPEA